MKSAYYPAISRTNRYVHVIESCITKNNIEVKGATLDGSIDYEIINLNWYESMFKKTYIEAVLEYYKKLRFIKKLKKNNTKIIWTVHNKMPHDGKYIKFAKKMMMLLVKESDQIIIHCKETIDVLKELDSSINVENKVSYIPHPNYENVYEEKNIDFRKELNIKKEKVFLFVGQIRPYKNVELIIKAAKEINDPNIKFIIAGNPSNRAYGKELMDLIDGNENIIPMFKYIEDDELVPLVKAADVLVLPYDLKSSLNSGVVLLAFTFGKTVICPNIGTLKDFNDESLFYAYEYSSEEEHESKLNKEIKSCYSDILKDENILDEKGKNLQNIVYEKYSIEVVSKKYKEVYEKVLSR